MVIFYCFSWVILLTSAIIPKTFPVDLVVQSCIIVFKNIPCFKLLRSWTNSPPRAKFRLSFIPLVLVPRLCIHYPTLCTLNSCCSTVLIPWQKNNSSGLFPSRHIANDWSHLEKWISIKSAIFATEINAMNFSLLVLVWGKLAGFSTQKQAIL